MFQSARLTLTTWYLVIIMMISILFSIAIYRLQTREFQEWDRRVIIRYQFERATHPNVPPPVMVTRTYLETSSQRLFISLVIINGIIFVLSGIAGYFLAGITLRPIRQMVDEQKRFVTDASHELRTPLTSLRAEIEVNLRDAGLTLKEAKDLLKSNLEEVENLQVLSDSLLQLSQAKKSGSAAHENVSLTVFIEDAIKKVKNQAHKKGITIQHTIGDEIVRGDRQSLIQLFVILLDNAVKYSPEKTTVTISSQKTDHHVKISITDQGQGIAKEEVPHIFDRFYRADASRSKQSVGGYGLGLAIAKKIVTEHNGNIEVKTKFGKGSTFVVNLPIMK